MAEKANVLTNLRVAEMFGPVLQGEGKSSGMPVFFIRLGGCNLECGGKNGILLKEGKAKWHCDSEALWKQSTEMTPEQVIANIIAAGELDRVLSGRTHIVITGGEPCLPQNKAAVKSLVEFFYHEWPEATPYFEMETNGTLCDSEFIDSYIDQVNCSPKLSSSGMSAERRINKESLEAVNNHTNSSFKLVIAEASDWEEIESDLLPIIDRDKIILMPAGQDAHELEETSKLVWDLACKQNLKACSRLHILT